MTDPKQSETDIESWRARWVDSRIGFHLDHIHPALDRHATLFEAKAEHQPSRVLVPLCGKTLDMAELSTRGFEVVGCELSPIAAQSFFKESGLSAQAIAGDGISGFATSNSGSGSISILVGDFFTLALHQFGPFDLIWDRAAMVALPPNTRPEYVAKLRKLLAPGGRLVLVTLEYDTNKASGPPFSVTPDIVRSLYGAEIQELFSEEQIESAPPCFVDSGIKSFVERTWVLGSKG